MRLKTLLALLLVVVPLLGFADASFVTYEKLSGTIPPCSPGFKCSAVLTSPWSSIGPVPLAMLGMFFYAIFFVQGLMYYFEKKEIVLGGTKLKMETALMFQGVFGAGFSAYLLYIMGVVLQAWCVYCLLSAATCIILFLLSGTTYLLAKKEPPHEVHI